MRFFFYGTLLDADVRDLVIGSRSLYSVEPAVLDGFRRLRMRGKTYPVVLRAPHLSVTGLLARGLDRDAAARLAAFESDEYQAEELVCAVSGRPKTCWVFTASPLARAATQPWDLERWQARHKRDFLRRHRGRGQGSA